MMLPPKKWLSDMEHTTIHIGNMSCQRSIHAVKAILGQLGLHAIEVSMGLATYRRSGDTGEDIVAAALMSQGFRLLTSEEEIIAEQVRIFLIGLAPGSPAPVQSIKVLAAKLEAHLDRPFKMLNKVFIAHTQHSIYKHLILLRLEKVKEMIEEGRHNFAEIADIMGYRTPQHLSGQFRKHVGISMLAYKTSKAGRRRFIDEL